MSVLGVWSIPDGDANIWTDNVIGFNIWSDQAYLSNSWTDDVVFFSVLSSNGQSYSVSREVLTSTGVAYLVGGEVLTSSGVIVDLANPWQNVSTASNTWSQ